MIGDEDKKGIDTAYRIVADHIRMTAVSLADGVQPGTDDREYVLITAF